MEIPILAVALLAAGVQDGGAVRRFLEAHCADCHGEERPKGGFRIDALRGLGDASAVDAAVRAYDRVHAGEMPPRNGDAPPAAERSAFLGELARDLEAAERRHAFAARPSVRRLSRVEYEHTLRDLLGLPSLRIKEELPEDGRRDGFDKVTGAMDLSAVQIGKYLAAADLALRRASARPAEPPAPGVWSEPAARQDSARMAVHVMNAAPLAGRELAPGYSTPLRGDPVKDPANTYRTGVFEGSADSIVLFTGPSSPSLPHGLQPDRFRVPTPGFYRVRFSVWGLTWNRTTAGPARPGRRDGDGDFIHAVRVSLGGRPIRYFDAPSLRPTRHAFDVWLDPGDKLSFHGMTLPSHGPPNWGSKEGARSYEGPGIAFDGFEIEGPLPGPRRPLFEGGTSRERLRGFAERAFRRPVAAVEVDRFVELVEALEEKGEKLDEALLQGARAVLCAPEFLYAGLEGTADFALASRLSYFLWDSMPDDALFEEARRGGLADPASLRAQVRRMLGDRRSDRFVEHFLDEWLDLRNIDFTTPDPQLHPDFDAWLRDSMLEETQATFRRMLDEDLGVAGLVSSDRILVNQRLARLYGIPGVSGTALRPVPVPEGSPRGGFLTQGAIWKVTANGTATSPILRGAWISHRLLGVDHRPPPPDVPAVEPDARGAVTIRQILEKHRADPACASCHAKIDPPGFALESFDAVGRFRDRYRATDARGKARPGLPVDASGTLADGRRFSDIRELRRHLAGDPAALARTLVRQWLVYATGSPLGFAGRADVELIVERAKGSGYGVRTLLEEAALSRPFRRAMPGETR